MEIPYIYRYTNAEVSADIYGTITVDYQAGISSRGYPFRLVAIPPEVLKAQLSLYNSLFYTVMDEQQWQVDQHSSETSPLLGQEQPVSGDISKAS